MSAKRIPDSVTKSGISAGFALPLPWGRWGRLGRLGSWESVVGYPTPSSSCWFRFPPAVPPRGCQIAFCPDSRRLGAAIRRVSDGS